MEKIKQLLVFWGKKAFNIRAFQKLSIV